MICGPSEPNSNNNNKTGDLDEVIACQDMNVILEGGGNAVTFRSPTWMTRTLVDETTLNNQGDSGVHRTLILNQR